MVKAKRGIMDIEHSCPCTSRFPPGEEFIDDDRSFCCKRLGKNILLCGRKSSFFPFQLFVGPEWYCMVVTYSLIVVLTIFFLVNAAVLLGPAVVAIGTISGLLTVWLFSATACSDPGIIFNYSAPSLNNNNNNTTFVDNVDEEADVVRTARGINIGGVMEEDDLPPTPRGSRTPKSRAVGASEAYAPAGDGPLRDAAGGLRSSASSLNTVNIGRLNRKSRSGTTASTRHGTGPNGEQWTMECSICQLYRPPTAVHCYECGVCVDQLDHHCPWTGKCIAHKNLFTFKLFLGVLGFHITFVVGATIYAVAMGINVFRMRYS